MEQTCRPQIICEQVLPFHVQPSQLWPVKITQQIIKQYSGILRAHYVPESNVFGRILDLHFQLNATPQQPTFDFII